MLLSKPAEKPGSSGNPAVRATQGPDCDLKMNISHEEVPGLLGETADLNSGKGNAEDKPGTSYA